MREKQSKDRPWLTGSGVEIPSHELKPICQRWLPETWETYLKWYESGRREALITPGSYAEICEEQCETIFKSLSRSVTPAKRKLVARLMSQLPEREACILRGIFLEGRTQVELAAEFSVSQPRIHQLKDRALASLKRGLLGDKFIVRRFMRGVSEVLIEEEPSVWELPMIPPPAETRRYLPEDFETEIYDLKNHDLREAVLKLPLIAQKIVYLRFWCGLSARQIARRLSKGMNVVEQISDASVSKIKRSVIEFQTCKRL